MSQAQQQCENCLKIFAQSKMPTHFGYCRRNIKKCDQCGEMYDINYKEEHQDQFHKKVKCGFCQLEGTELQIGEHTKTCDSRAEQCEHCEQKVPLKVFDAHVAQCQARTKPCEKCGSPVTFKDYFIHVTICPGKQQQQKLSDYEKFLKDIRAKKSKNKTQKDTRDAEVIGNTTTQHSASDITSNISKLQSLGTSSNEKRRKNEKIQAELENTRSLGQKFKPGKAEVKENKIVRRPTKTQQNVTHRTSRPRPNYVQISSSSQSEQSHSEKINNFGGYDQQEEQIKRALLLSMDQQYKKSSLLRSIPQELQNIQEARDVERQRLAYEQLTRKFKQKTKKAQ